MEGERERDEGHETRKGTDVPPPAHSPGSTAQAPSYPPVALLLLGTTQRKDSK